MITIVLLLGLFFSTCSGCIAPGNSCWSSSGGVVADGCCGGTQCAPWLPSGGTWDGTSDWYCLFLPKLPLGTACNYDNKIGLCESGTCCNNICSATCTSSSSSASSSTVASASGSSTSSVAPTTTTNNCQLAAQGVCAYSAYQTVNFGCCQSPYVCTSVSSDVSVCTGSNLTTGQTCWSSPDSTNQPANTGTCDTTSGLICFDGVCAADDASCSEPGVEGHNLCYIASVSQAVNNQVCCSSSDGVAAYCSAATDSQDSFCMKYPVAVGQPCGTTAATNYAGVCEFGTAVCDNGVCRSTMTTAAPSTTSTTTAAATPAATTAACIASGQSCWVNNAPGTCCGSGCPVIQGSAATCP